jgi:hypothetical protein
MRPWREGWVSELSAGAWKRRRGWASAGASLAMGTRPGLPCGERTDVANPYPQPAVRSPGIGAGVDALKVEPHSIGRGGGEGEQLHGLEAGIPGHGENVGILPPEGAALLPPLCSSGEFPRLGPTDPPDGNLRQLEDLGLAENQRGLQTVPAGAAERDAADLHRSVPDPTGVPAMHLEVLGAASPKAIPWIGVSRHPAESRAQRCKRRG